MSTRNRIAFGAAFLMLSLGISSFAKAGEGGLQVCDAPADYALGVEDYPQAIRLHSAVVRHHADDALAHYHLGFAEGMVGNRVAEVREYQRAESLGLRNWDLFLNLGLAQLENGDLNGATTSLRQAVLLGEDHPESHFNLALAYQRRGMLANAESETLASLQLNPQDADTRNLLGVVYAQQGKTAGAWMVWGELAREVPEYAPARKNLALMGGQHEVVLGETAAVVLPPAAAVKTTEDQPKPSSPINEPELAMLSHK